MVNKEKAIIELLIGEDYRNLNQDLYNLVGDKIKPVPLDDVEYPAISYIDISGNKDNLLPIGRPRVQFNCYAENVDGNGYSKSQEVFKALDKIFTRFKGIVKDIKIKQIIYINDFPFYFKEIKLWKWTADYYIVFQNE